MTRVVRVSHWTSQGAASAERALPHFSSVGDVFPEPVDLFDQIFRDVPHVVTSAGLASAEVRFVRQYRLPAKRGRPRADRVQASYESFELWQSSFLVV